MTNRDRDESLAWTTERPHEAGVYWAWGPGYAMPQMVELSYFQEEQMWRVDILGLGVGGSPAQFTHWYGPLEPPGGIAAE